MYFYIITHHRVVALDIAGPYFSKEDAIKAITSSGYNDKVKHSTTFVDSLFFSIVSVDGVGKMTPITTNFTLKDASCKNF